MEAAWDGNIEKIKSLALQPWGPEQDQPPLKLAVADNMGNTPFSVAFLRGHHDISRAILEMVKAQWSPVEKEKVRFRMEAHGEDDEYSDDESDVSDDGEPRIVSEKVSHNFTIDDIGHVSMQVKSHVKPLSVIHERVPIFTVEGDKIIYDNVKRDLFTHAFSTDDASRLKTLLDMVQYCLNQKFEGDDEESTTNWTFPHDTFMYGVKHGKTELLGFIIKRYGAGIPLDYLVKKSGVEISQKSRTYQGLTVYGKKRFGFSYKCVIRTIILTRLIERIGLTLAATWSSELLAQRHHRYSMLLLGVALRVLNSFWETYLIGSTASLANPRLLGWIRNSSISRKALVVLIEPSRSGLVQTVSCRPHNT